MLPCTADCDVRGIKRRVTSLLLVLQADIEFAWFKKGIALVLALIQTDIYSAHFFSRRLPWRFYLPI